MTDQPRLIEYAFPLKQASLDSVHEKNVRHGHISTLHIWPARRPLAACRAALIATLLPDPGTPEKRQELCEKIGGKVVQKIERKKMPNGQVVERLKEETEGGILHWKRETENVDELEWFRQEIRQAYGGRAPKVLDPFAGGGAIPLEAMRLGCEATAIDINPVAWFILKCTLEYPQKLAGQKRPLPSFVLKNRDFMAGFFKAQGLSKGQINTRLKKLGIQADDQQESIDFERLEDVEIEADLAWHVRAWGQWVLEQARRELARFYPTYADFEPLDKHVKAYEPQPMRLVPLKEDGTPDIETLNAEFGKEYLAVKSNPRWVAKPTVAYLWARTVKCKNCRGTVPLLKTQWLCKKNNKRVLLTMEPKADGTGVSFGVQKDVSVIGGNAAKRREHDKRLGAGTMSRAGVTCPFCKTILTMEDLRLEGQAGRLGMVMTAVVVAGKEGKEYRLLTEHEVKLSAATENELMRAFADVPFGLPQEPLPSKEALGFRMPLYGFDQWNKLFAPRQLLALGTFVKHTRYACATMQDADYSPEWIEAVQGCLALAVDRLADRSSTLCRPDPTPTQSGVINTFSRFALPMTWDFIEAVTIEDFSGGFHGAIEWIAKVADQAMNYTGTHRPWVVMESVTKGVTAGFDVIITDPPYYDAIPYSDLMDFFYVWLRRTLYGSSSEIDIAFREPLAPKWDHAKGDGELIDDASRFDGDRVKSKAAYEDGMFRAFQACHTALNPAGRLVIVFAHKHPDAWETLVSAIVRAGFIVDGSWPIQTEMGNRTRALTSAALASSVWLVCRKRMATARPGWDNKVLAEMRAKISGRLRDFWDAGIRGPDFVWAATGPALEAYSKYPVVKKADDPGHIMTVSEFLTHVRRMVVDFVVGRVLSGDGEDNVEATADRLDEPTAYYLLHRHDFGMQEALAGTCILYAVSCGLSDHELLSTWDLLAKTGGSSPAPDAEEGGADADDDVDTESSSGSMLKLKTWSERRGRSMGYEAPGGRPVPLIDRVHRLMHLWKGGDVHKVDEYLDDYGLRRHELFLRVVQSMIELSKPGSEERSLLESLSNHTGAKGVRPTEAQQAFAYVSKA
jgi:putative DNA methylase